MTADSIPRYLGAHVSAAGGAYRAVQRIQELGGTAMQLFTRNQRQWKRPRLDDAAVAAFRRARSEWGAYPIASHDSYLTNLAAPPGALREKSIQAFADELAQCQALGIPFLVTHPGAHKGQGLEQGIVAYVKALDLALDQALELSPGGGVTVLLENTAGQGSSLGARFEELGAIIAASRHPERLGICLDTCHAFAAGYDLRDEAGHEATLAALDMCVGLDRLGFIHLNDSKHGLGERKDRHEHIGQGHLGADAFRRILRDPRLSVIPMVIETPKDKDGEFDRMNLHLMRKLARAGGRETNSFTRI
jgi:deoxyribonuclease IV